MELWRRHVKPKSRYLASNNNKDENFSECSLVSIFKGKTASDQKSKSALGTYSRNSVVALKLGNSAKKHLVLSTVDKKSSKGLNSETYNNVEKRARAILKRSFQNSIERGLSYQRYIQDSYNPRTLPYLNSEHSLASSARKNYQKGRNKATGLNKTTAKSSNVSNDLTSITLFTDRNPYKDRKDLNILYAIKQESTAFQLSECIARPHEVIAPTGLQEDKHFKKYAATHYEYVIVYKVCKKQANLRNMDENESLEAFAERYFPGYSKKKIKTIAGLLFPFEVSAGEECIASG